MWPLAAPSSSTRWFDPTIRNVNAWALFGVSMSTTVSYRLGMAYSNYSSTARASSADGMAIYLSRPFRLTSL
jgi:hypothetical protein